MSLKLNFNASEKLGNLIKRNPILFIISIMILTIVFGFLTTKIDTNVAMEDYMPETKVLDADERVERDFGVGKYTIPMVVESKDGNVLTKSSLQ